MNERIKTFAWLAGSEGLRQVGGYIEDAATGDSVWVEQMKLDPEMVDLEKFAELIVRECLDIVSNADMTELEGPDPEDVLYVACKQIKQHFGVEQ